MCEKAESVICSSGQYDVISVGSVILTLGERILSDRS